MATKVQNVEKLRVLTQNGTVENIFKVPVNQWRKWPSKSKEIFNHLYSVSLMNQAIICGTDIFGTSEQVEKVLNATLWNLAWEAADFVKTEILKK